MKKFLIFVILSLFCCISSSKAVELPDLPNKQNTIQQAQNVSSADVQKLEIQKLYDFGTSYDKAIIQDKPVVLLFYTTWCSACKRALPLIQAQQEKFKDSYVFTSLDSDKNEQYAAVIRDYRLRCFPTVYIIDPKYNTRIHIEVSYLFNADAFSHELNRYLNIRKILDSK